jgi:cytochrome c oxidase subunit 1
MVGLVYVALPRYTNRHWETSAVLAIAWWGTLIFVVTAEFHHLYMDFAEPRSLQYLGEAVSYLSGLPVAVVTVFGGALLVYRSAMRWSLGSLFIYAGFVGWVVGGIGALLDATIPFNLTFHNTLWVVAHFHTYLLGGVFFFVAGWVFHLLEETAGARSAVSMRWAVGLLVFGGEAMLLIPWYIAGAAGVPRRYSMQISPGPQLSLWASAGAILLLIGLLLALVAAIGLRRGGAGRRVPRAPGSPAMP